MFKNLVFFSVFLALRVSIPHLPTVSAQQAAPAPIPDKVPAEDAKLVNPVKPTAESLAHIKKLYGYDCAMCHGKNGDGQGDLADSMKLKLKDWRDPASIKELTDGELFYIISKGRGQMPAGAEQMKPNEIWTMVIYVRSLADKNFAAKGR
jgi:mono/diheme cytochrome c family protein